MSDPWREAEEPRRLSALRHMMRERDLDAVVIVGGASLTYFSGFAGVERSMARPMLYICPREGDPAIVAHTFRTHLVEAYSWVGTFHFYTQLAEAPLEATASALQAMGIRGGRLGFELGYEGQINMPFGEFERLRAHLAGTVFVDVARDIWRIRMVRSEGELERQRKAASIVRSVIAESFAFVKRGMRQAELQRFIAERMVAYGSGPSFAIVSAGPKGYDFCGAWAPDTVFDHGDMVWMDVGASVGGYTMLFSRAGVIGGATREQAETARAVNAATMAGVSAIRPGVPLSAVAAVCERELNAIKAPVTTNIAVLSTRHGHGIGMDFVEPPHVAPYDPTILAPGMVLAVEPGFATPYGRFHFRQVPVVTETGFDLIEGPSSDLAALSDAF